MSTRPPGDEAPAFHPGRLLGGVGLFLLGLGMRLWWLSITQLTFEDAFITFRYAAQLAGGAGFVYNPGEYVSGTTTPLLTLLLAAWIRLAGSQDIILAARLIGLAAYAVTFAGTLLALRAAGVGTAQQLTAVGLLALTPRLWNMDTGGMETPLVLAGMAAAWYALLRGKEIASGVLLGLLLWVRLDTAVWVLVLAAAAARIDLKKGLRLALSAGVVILPWVIFAWGYFGSPIPHTIYAKWVNYAMHDANPLWQPLPNLLGYLFPFPFPDEFAGLARLFTGLALLAAAWQAWRWRARPLLAVLPVYALLETARLLASRATFFNRYYVPLSWAVWILVGAAAGMVWQAVRRPGGPPRLVQAGLYASAFTGLVCLTIAGRLANLGNWLPVLLWGILFILALWLAPRDPGRGLSLALLVVLGGVIAVPAFSGTLQQTFDSASAQRFRNEGSLKAIGMWLNQNTAPGSSVLLEPLGYVGYYSQRVMRDEVGLVAPQVTELKRQGQLDVFDYLSILKPDYVVQHCDDALRWAQRDGGENEFTAGYGLAMEANPLSFDPRDPHLHPIYQGLPRDACYQVWQRRAVQPRLPTAATPGS
ncbi:MAG: hypothetical protein VB089_01655 [Anaerolineaceae bacterium]|nr:hypothetical protein [Anaerolineaceae bacterium]